MDHHDDWPTRDPSLEEIRSIGPTEISHRVTRETFCRGVGPGAFRRGLVPLDRLIREPELVLEIRNIDARRAAIDAIGIGRLIDSLKAAVLDRKGDYELLQVESPIEKGAVRRYLKMVNPSVGGFHIEAVPPRTATVQAALNYRAGSLLKPGENWEPDRLT